MSFFSTDRADLLVDLGTVNTRIATPEKGIVLDEPSLVALDEQTNQVIAIGSEARERVGRTSENIQIVSPFKNGVIADFDICIVMLNAFIDKMTQNTSNIFHTRPRILAAIPYTITPVEKHALHSVFESCHARKVMFEQAPVMAALGAGFNLDDIHGTMIINMGAGITEISVISSGEIVAAKAIPIAGNQCDHLIYERIRDYYDLLVGHSVAEDVKKSIGSAIQLSPELDVEVRGLDRKTHQPWSQVIASEQVRAALAKPLDIIVYAIKDLLDSIQPELTGDILRNGALLTGGMAALKGLDSFLASQTGIAIHTSNDPLHDVITGLLKQNTLG